jgi:hypothetical protein
MYAIAFLQEKIVSEKTHLSVLNGNQDIGVLMSLIFIIVHDFIMLLFKQIFQCTYSQNTRNSKLLEILRYLV